MTVNYRDKEWLEEQLQEKERDLEEIAKEEGTVSTVIDRWAKLHGIYKQ